MCSVRQSPMPCAPKSRAVRASAGVSALARMPMSQTAPAQSWSVRNASSRAGGSMSASPASTSPEVPSTVMTSPSAKLRPPAVRIKRRLGSKRRSEAPTMQGSPRPRPITAAWLVMPPRSVSTATAECMPRISSGAVSRRTRMQGSPRAAWACAVAEEKAMRPVAAPGEAAMPRATTSRAPRGSTWGCRSSLSARGSTRSSASSRAMIPSEASATAMRSLARAERGVRTASITARRPSSTVNSICISSRRRARQAAPWAERATRISGATSSSAGPRGSRVRNIASAPSAEAGRPWLWPA